MDYESLHAKIKHQNKKQQSDFISTIRFEPHNNNLHNIENKNRFFTMVFQQKPKINYRDNNEDFNPIPH